MITAAKEENASGLLATLLETRVRGLPPGNATGTGGCSWVTSTLRWGSWETYDRTSSARLVGLDYFGARYFSGVLGRFTSPDEPLVWQDRNSPQSWNLYSYGLNNPLRFTDPTGHGPEDQTGDNTPCGLHTKDCAPAIVPGVYSSTDNRFALFADPHRTEISRTGVDKTIGPEFDAVMLAPALAKAPAIGATRRRRASWPRHRRGHRYRRQSGWNRDSAKRRRPRTSCRSPSCGGRHRRWGTNTALAAGTRTIVSESAGSRPLTSFITRVGTGAGEVPCKAFCRASRRKTCRSSARRSSHRRCRKGRAGND